MTLWEVAAELSRRLDADLPARRARAARPSMATTSSITTDPHWRDLVLFYEYFHGDNGAGLGASHQTGWTGLVAKLLQQSGERVPQERSMRLRLELPELETVLGD